MNLPNPDPIPAPSAHTPSGEGAPSSQRAALGTSVSADLEALRNDVEQAKLLACDYQQQLAQQSNDHAALKEVFQKTRDDLIRLQDGITQLREERHQFANDAMRAAALELKLERVTRERDCLQNEVTALRRTRAAEGDDRVAQLSLELERVRGSAAGGATPGTTPGRKQEYITVPFAEPIVEDEITFVPTEVPPVTAVSRLRR